MGWQIYSELNVRDEERRLAAEEAMETQKKKKTNKKWGIRDFRMRKTIQLSFYRTKNPFRGRYFVVLAAEKEVAAGFQVPISP